MTRFEWDERKNLSNQRKHGIAFQEASAIFGDPQAILRSDRVVDDEERSHITGLLRHGLGDGRSHGARRGYCKAGHPHHLCTNSNSMGKGKL